MHVDTLTLWSGCHRVLTDGHLTLSAPQLCDMADDFRRRCRRLDYHRKRLGGTLGKPLRDAQREARSCVGQAIKCLISLASVDMDQLTHEERVIAREQAREVAATLLLHRPVFEAGGITSEYVDRVKAPRN